MQDIAIYSINLIACLAIIITYFWALFGAFRSSRAVGWLTFFVPALGALAWSILDWQKARTPILTHLCAAMTLYGTGFFT